MECSKSIGILTCLLLCTLATTCAFASWQEYGNAACAHDTAQYNPRITSDGTGGGVIVWEDWRGVARGVYAQRVDASGNMLWVTDGVAVCTASGLQDALQLIPDGTGGAIIVWRDYRSGSSYDIYAQRVDGAGVVQWTPDGVAICTLGLDQNDPRVTSDGAGGAIITWTNFDILGDDKIAAQRVDASGAVKWTPGGVAICGASGRQSQPRITSDGTGGALIAWADYRSGSDWDLYAQHVDSTGYRQWPSDGYSVCTYSGSQYYSEVVPDGGGGCIVAWRDYRGSSYDIYAQRLDAYGAKQWAANGVAICTSSGTQDYHQVIQDGAGGAIIAWRDYRGSDHDVYAQRVDASGAVQWAADGLAVCTAEGQQSPPHLTTDGLGGTIITWSDERGVDYDIYAQRVDASGVIQWAVDGEVVCSAPQDQSVGGIASDVAGGAIITWYDERTGNSDIYCQRIERNGYWGYPAPDIYAVRDVPGDQGGSVNVAWDASRLDPWPEMLITNYTVWRAISAEAVAGMVEDGAHVLTSISDVLPELEGSVLRVEEVENETYYWKLMSTIDAYYLDAYSEVVATLFDSTSVCDEYHYFQVIAHTSTPSVFWVSEADSGYSVDNLSPGAPQGVSGDYSYPPSELLITWEPNSEADLSHYAVYKGADEDFVPGEGNRLGTVQDSFFVDDAFDPDVDNYYKVSAWDIHENESSFSLLAPDEITGVESPPAVPTVTLLEQNVPNPFNPVTVIRFSIAEPGMVGLVVYDVSGRPVRRLVQGRREADRYEVIWDGRDDAGRAVASGVYLYRLEAPGYLESKKMVLLK